MKKLMILAVALFSMTTTFAADENASATTATAAFNMNVNMNSLSDALGLNIDQVEAVGDVHKNFTADMMNAAVAAGDDRKAMIDKAINKDLKYMHVILSNTQYRKYLMLLNVTLVSWHQVRLLCKVRERLYEENCGQSNLSAVFLLLIEPAKVES